MITHHTQSRHNLFAYYIMETIGLHVIGKLNFVSIALFFIYGPYSETVISHARNIRILNDWDPILFKIGSTIFYRYTNLVALSDSQ